MDGNKCRGKIFRATVSNFYRKGVYETRRRLCLMKRLSCPGCENCDWILEILQEDAQNTYYPDIEDGMLYRADVKVYLEDPYIIFQKLKSKYSVEEPHSVQS